MEFFLALSLKRFSLRVEGDDLELGSLLGKVKSDVEPEKYLNGSEQGPSLIERSYYGEHVKLSKSRPGWLRYYFEETFAKFDAQGNWIARTAFKGKDLFSIDSSEIVYCE